MSFDSPIAVLFSRDGYDVVITDGYNIVAKQPGVIMAGKDGSTARFISINSSGNPIIVGAGIAGTPSGGVVSIQGVSGGTVIPISGTLTANIGTTNGLALDATLAKLTISPSTALGSNTLAMVGGSVTTAAPTYTNGNINPLSLTTTGALRTDNSSWLGSTAPTVGSKTSANSIPVVIASDQGAVTVTGTVTATNASVSTTGSAPPASATYIGGSVTTAAPTYTTGQMSALSLTTSGLLRIDGSGVTQPVSGTITANIGTSGSLALDATVTAQTLVDNAAFTDGTTRVQPAGYIFDEVAGTALTENDAAAARIDSKRAQINVLEDGTTRGTRNTIKAASTAAVATDTALVVAISPNNTININSPDTTATATLNALNAAASVALTGENSVGMRLAAGTLIGTIVPEISIDGGTTWVGTFFDDPSTGNKVSSIVYSSSNTVATRTIVGAGGASNARVRVSAFTSGTASCNIRSTNINDPTLLISGAAAAAVPPVMAHIGGTVTTAAPTYTNNTLNALSLTTAGALRVDGSGTSTGITGTVKPLYGTNGQTVTITLASLTNGSARASTAIDNTSTLYEDVLIFIKITTGASGVSATGYVNVFGYGTVDGGTTYPEGITGTNAAATLTTPPNLVILAQINANTNAATKTYGPFSYCRQYGVDRLPASWGVVVTNNTGATFNATAGNFSITYQGVNGQLV